jgi:monothiol glutaredoxin
MTRPILDDSKLHPAIREKVGTYQADILREVQTAVRDNDVVVVGMRINPAPKRAIKALKAAGVKHVYLEYGSYFSEWRRRLALKMWTGWPTFPMVFVKGTLVGGADDTEKLIASGELMKMIDEKPKKSESKSAN